LLLKGQFVVNNIGVFFISSTYYFPADLSEYHLFDSITAFTIVSRHFGMDIVHCTRRTRFYRVSSDKNLLIKNNLIPILIYMSTLYIIATPIGNLEDFTFRALRLLKDEVSAVFCEDTRQSHKLLSHYGIDLPAFSIHSHSKDSAIEKALSILDEGKSIAYMTDCGTPAVSDPGSRLASAARTAGHAVSPIPGASALTALASVSGFPGKSLHFGGFLSKKEGRRRKELSALMSISGILVIYESPHRIRKTLSSIAAIFPDKQIIIGREMTKMFEEFICGKAADLALETFHIKEKGEFAIAIDNSDPADINSEEETD